MTHDLRLLHPMMVREILDAITTSEALADIIPERERDLYTGALGAARLAVETSGARKPVTKAAIDCSAALLHAYGPAFDAWAAAFNAVRAAENMLTVPTFADLAKKRAMSARASWERLNDADRASLR